MMFPCNIGEVPAYMQRNQEAYLETCFRNKTAKVFDIVAREAFGLYGPSRLLMFMLHLVLQGKLF